MTGSLTNYSVAKVVIKTKSPKERLRFFAKVVQGDVAYRGLERGLACAKGRNRGVAQGDVPWRGLESGCACTVLAKRAAGKRNARRRGGRGGRRLGQRDASIPGHGKGKGPGEYKLFDGRKACFPTANDAVGVGKGRSEYRGSGRAEFPRPQPPPPREPA